jgi:hypothetical protein
MIAGSRWLSRQLAVLLDLAQSVFEPTTVVPHARR